MEPVYRGLLQVVGDRVTVRMEEFDPPGRDVCAVRLGYVRDGQVFVAAEARFDAGTHDRSVTGFVPRDAEGWFTEEIDAEGQAIELCSHGTDAMYCAIATR
jgi:hypothetical protein